MEPWSFEFSRLLERFRPLSSTGVQALKLCYRQLFTEGKASSLNELERYKPGLAGLDVAFFQPLLPVISSVARAGETCKFLMPLNDGPETESVIIPMAHYRTLCISSQVGCMRGCRFCETAKMGLVRSLTAAEMVLQVLAARLVLREPVRNVVFMGMGEPMDNLDEVLQAVRVLSDQRGMCIGKSGITVSTVGVVEGIRRLNQLRLEDEDPLGLRRLRLAVSLNAPEDDLRSQLMPVNRASPLEELKEALLDFKLYNRKELIFVGYVLMKGLNDSAVHARKLAGYLKGLRSCVNLIPYNPAPKSPYERADNEGLRMFYETLRENGQPCNVRTTKGDEAMAACGQLGNRDYRRSAKKVA